MYGELNFELVIPNIGFVCDCIEKNILKHIFNFYTILCIHYDFLDFVTQI